MYFYNVILKFCPYLNIGCRGILEPKKKIDLNRESPLNSNIDILASEHALMRMLRDFSILLCKG